MLTKPVCPVCGTSTERDPLTRVEGYSLHECNGCHLRFSNPMKHPGREWYEKSPHYIETVAETFNVPLWITQNDWRFRTFLALELKPKGYLLDVGCGHGAFLRLARSYGYKVSGIDISNRAIKVAREKSDLRDTYVMSVEDLPTKLLQRRFDIISLFDVLEHLENPVAALTGLRKLLKPGAYIVCTVPSYQRWPKLFLSYIDLPPHHLTLWSISALEKCMSNAGLEVTEIKRSPLVTENLSYYIFGRLRKIRAPKTVNAAIKASAYFSIAPIMTKILSTVTGAGGFTLFCAAKNR